MHYANMMETNNITISKQRVPVITPVRKMLCNLLFNLVIGDIWK